MGLASEEGDRNAFAQELSRRKRYYCPLGSPPDSVGPQSDSFAMKAHTLALKKVATAMQTMHFFTPTPNDDDRERLP